jgi:hypothetical protein
VIKTKNKTKNNNIMINNKKNIKREVQKGSYLKKEDINNTMINFRISNNTIIKDNIKKIMKINSKKIMNKVHIKKTKNPIHNKNLKVLFMAKNLNQDYGNGQHL